MCCRAAWLCVALSIISGLAQHSWHYAWNTTEGTWASVDGGVHGPLGQVFQLKDYETYVEAQAKANKEKLGSQWVSHESISMLAHWLRQNTLFVHNFGICHGTRSGKEQLWFQHGLGWENGTVIGTEISDTAEQFPNTIQWDFHDVKDEWVSKADFVYSNSLDQAFDPKLALTQWMRCLQARGVLIIEHCSSHTILNVRGADPDESGQENWRFTSDIFGASFSEYLRLILSIPTADVAEVLRAPGKHWYDYGCRFILVVHRASRLQVVQPFHDSYGPRLFQV